MFILSECPVPENRGYYGDRTLFKRARVKSKEIFKAGEMVFLNNRSVGGIDSQAVRAVGNAPRLLDVLSFANLEQRKAVQVRDPCAGFVSHDGELEQHLTGVFHRVVRRLHERRWRIGLRVSRDNLAILEVEEFESGQCPFKPFFPD